MSLLSNASPLTTEAAHNAHTATSRLETVLAALPPALMGLMLSAFLLGLMPLTQIVWGGPTRVRITNPILIAYVAPSLVGVALIIGGLYGASQRLPRWSYTWETGAVVVVLFGLVILGDELPYLISPTVDLLIVLSLLGLLAGLGGRCTGRPGLWRDFCHDLDLLRHRRSLFTARYRPAQHPLEAVCHSLDRIAGADSSVLAVQDAPAGQQVMMLPGTATFAAVHDL